MNKTQIHGLIFSSLSLSLALGYLLGYLLGVDLTLENSLYFLVALIFFLGIPHGALDPVFAKKMFNIESWKSWATFAASYLVVSLSIISLWWIQPLLFMTLFLAMSTHHFSRDLPASTHWIARTLYGGSVIVLSTVFHKTEVLDIFCLITGPQIGLKTVNALHLISTPWLLALAATLICELARDWMVGLEIISVAVLALFTPPLVAFTVYFCLMHSLRHVMRSQTFANLSYCQLSLYAFAPMLGTFILAALAWNVLPSDQDQDQARVLRFLFVGLASLTAPHMLLIDRVKYTE